MKNDAAIVSIVAAGKAELGNINTKSSDKTSIPAYNNAIATIDFEDKEVKNMDNNDWAKQYIESVDRNLSDIRKESNENRREIKNDIRDYIIAVNKKIDDSVEESRITRRELKDEIKEIKEDVKDIKKDNNDTRKWILGVGISVIVAMVALTITMILSIPHP